MSEPLSNHEIEDVLSSIRRLVSTEPRRRSRDLGHDKLLLTPALRVVPDAVIEARPEPEAEQLPAQQAEIASEPLVLATFAPAVTDTTIEAEGPAFAAFDAVDLAEDAAQLPTDPLAEMDDFAPEPMVDWMAPPPEPLLDAVDEAVFDPVTESVAEPVAEPVAETVVEPLVEQMTEVAVETVVEPVTEIAAETVAEPVIEPVTEIAAETVVEPVIELAASDDAEVDPVAAFVRSLSEPVLVEEADATASAAVVGQPTLVLVADADAPIAPEVDAFLWPQMPADPQAAVLTPEADPMSATTSPDVPEVPPAGLSATLHLIDAEWEDEIWEEPEPTLAELADEVEDAELVTDGAGQADGDGWKLANGPVPFLAHRRTSYVPEPEPTSEPVAEPVAEAVAEPVAGLVAEPMFEAERELGPEPVPEPVAEAVLEPAAEVFAEPEAALAEAAPMQAATEAPEAPLAAAVAAGASPEPEPEPENAGALAVPPEDDATDLDAGYALVDEDVLHEIVRDLIREELQGALGERITRNVRKLVRAEINRALASRPYE